MYKENYLAAFIERLNTYQVIYTTPFLVLYEYWFIEVSDLLHNEIDENLLLLDPEKHKKYLEIVLSKIKKNIIYMQNPLILDKWIEKYDLSKYEFPFLKNKEVKQILATSISQDKLDYEKKKIATNMQIDFYCYSAMIEVQKMIYFIDNQLNIGVGFIGNLDLSETNNIHIEIKRQTEIQQNPLKATKNSITTFKWKPNSGNQLSTILWQKLKDEKFIASSTEFVDFHKAFDGLTIEQPLKIKWTAIGKNKQINKQLLFYLLNTLADKYLIEEDTDNATFIKKISSVFCKQDGTEISHLKVSNSTSTKKSNIKNRVKTPDEIRIDVIIDIITQITTN